MRENNLTETTSNETGLFLTAPFKGKNAFWRYFVLSVLPFLVSNFIGGLIIVIVLMIYTKGTSLAINNNMFDFQAMGIDQNMGFLIMVFPFLLALITFIVLIKPLNERSLATVINGGRRIRWGRIFYAMFLWTLLSAGYLYFSIKADPSNFVLLNTSKSLLVLAVIVLLCIPFQAGFEELIFRGYLMQGFAVWSRNRWVPLIVTSVMFGLMHSFNPEVKAYGFFTMIPQYVFFGLVFAILTMMDDGIELSIGAHTANNAFLSIFLTHKDSTLQTPAMYEQVEIFPWYEFMWLIIMSVLFLVITAVIFRWKDIKKLYSKIERPDERMEAEAVAQMP